MPLVPNLQVGNPVRREAEPFDKLRTGFQDGVPNLEVGNELF